MMNILSPRIIKSKLDRGEDILLIDVREEYESVICKIPSTRIPMAELVQNKDQIPLDKEVVFFCKTGKRASAIVYLLQTEHGFQNLIIMEGGILGWIENVDESLEKY